MKVLLTGGAGYIGSHVSRTLMEAGCRVAVVDNLSTGDPRIVSTLARLGGDAFRFHRADILRPDELDTAFSRFAPDAVIHLARRKDVGESFERPNDYYVTNVQGTANVLEAAARHDCGRVIFSSSAAVYGAPVRCPLHEDDVPVPVSPYGKTKLLGEELVRQWSLAAPKRRRSIVLRYFNPCGRDFLFARPPEVGGNTGNSLAVAVAAVAAGKKRRFEVYGRNHPTPDGICRRDYVHIRDIAAAHVCATMHIGRERSAFDVFNVGSGADVSVLEFLDAYRRATGVEIPFAFRAARRGDPAVSCADISKAGLCMGWRPRHDLMDICRTIHDGALPARAVVRAAAASNAGVGGMTLQ